MFCQLAPEAVDDLSDAMEQPPEQEGPPGGRATTSAEQERNDEIAEHDRFAAPVAAERNVNIIAQEAAERHVPAPPEILDAERLVRRIEVLRQLDVEKTSAAPIAMSV